jgi:hypothetical protein
LRPPNLYISRHFAANPPPVEVTEKGQLGNTCPLPTQQIVPSLAGN